MRRWLFLVGSCLSFAVGCGGSSSSPDAPGPDGSTGGADARSADAPRPDAGGGGQIDARPPTPDAPNNQADAGPPPDAGCTTDAECAGGAGDSCNAAGQVVTCAAVPGFPTCFHASAGTACPGVQTCQGAGVCTCPSDPTCGTATSGTVCGAGGGLVTCSADAQGCAAASAEVACASNDNGSLVCSAGACVCPTADQGTVENGPCANIGMQVCETGGANGQNNVLACTSVAIGDQQCQLWETFGGSGQSGDCRAAGVTCDPVAHECACPAHAGNVWFANPVNVTDRTLFHQLSLVETGVQGPPACAFETATVAIQHGKAQILAGTAAGAVVVLAGGTSPFTPAIFDNETWNDSTFDIDEGLRVTVDTDTLVGINPPQGVVFDPRNTIVVYNNQSGGRDSAFLLSGGIGGAGNKLHGFTVAGGDSSDTFITAVEDQGGTGVRVDSMLLEGGGGRVIDASTAAAPNPGALTVGTRSVTITFAQSDTDIRSDLNNARFILVNGATAIQHDGVFRITDINFPDADTVALTYFTNVPGLAADTAATWAVSAQGPLSTGLAVDGGTGSYQAIMAENFWIAGGVAKVGPAAALPDPGDGLAVFVGNTGSGGVTFAGLYLFDNFLGFEANNGTVNVTADGLTGFITTFAHAVTQPMIEHSFVNGLEVDGATVTTNNLRVFDTQADFGVSAFDGTLHVNGGSIDTNTGGGLIVDGAFWVTADATSISSNVGTGALVDGVEANATFTGTHIDSNTGTGLDNQGQLVFVFGGADNTTSINSNNLGLNQSGGTTTVNGLTGDDLSGVGLVNITSNTQQGVTANAGTLHLSKAEVDSNAVNSTGQVGCDPGTSAQMAIIISGTATLNLNASAVQINNGGGLSVNSSSAATITSSTISSNAAALPSCGDFDGIEAFSTVHFSGAVQSNVQTNHGNGIQVHDSGILTTAGGGVNVGSNDFDGILIDGTGSVTLGATDVVSTNCQTGGSAGIEVNGGLTATGTTVSGNLCDGILVDQFGPQTKLTGITSTANTGDGVHITNATANDDVDDGSEAPVADSIMGVQIIGGSIITANTANGVEIGGGDQDDSIYALIANSFIDSNGGAGVLAVGGDDDSAPATFLSLVSNAIVANKGPGLDDTGAHLRAATISGTDNAGFSKNDIEHNGFASETQCLSGETFGQIIFHGALVQLEAAQCSDFATDVNACEDGTNATHCIFNSTTSQCFHAYWLQGGTTDTCDQQNTNIISGYAGETSTNQTGANVVGVNAVGGAAVNASGNTWKHSSPALTIDIANDAASFVKRVGACQAHNTCIPAPH